MERWRVLKLGEVDAYTAMAMSEMLGIAKNKGMIGNTLVIYIPQLSVAVGRRTSLSQVNTSLCREKDIPVVRHYLDGGTFLNGNKYEYVLVSDKGFFPRVDFARDSLPKSVVKACKILGLSARQRPSSNDVLVGGRKIAGMTPVRVLEDTLIWGGTLTLDFNYELAEKLLRIPASKFRNKEAKTVSEWVTSARRELEREVSNEEVETALVQGFGEVLGVEFDEGVLTEEESAIMDELTVRYSSESWIKYGKWSPVKEYWRPQ